MEEENVVQEIKGSYFMGIIGAVIGAIIATIPWVIAYVYLQYILSALAMIVAFGAFYGYKLFKGRMGKGAKIIIIVASLLAIIGATLGVIPVILANKNDYEVSAVYKNEEFMNSLYKDLGVSVLFAALGIAAALPSIKTNINKASGKVQEKDEVAKKQEELVEAQVNSKVKGKKKEELESVREAFKGLNAYSKETAVSKNEIISAIKNGSPEKTFKRYKNLGIIVKSKENYYYDKSKEIILTNTAGTYLIWFIMLVVVVSTVVLTSDTDTVNNESKSLSNLSSYSTEDGKIDFKLPKNWEEDQVDYVNSAFIVEPNGDASVYIDYVKKDEFGSRVTLSDLKDTLDEYIEETYNAEDIGKVKKVTVNDYDAYTVDFNYVDDTGLKTYAIIYYIETDNYFVEVYQYTKKSKQDEYKDVFENMVNSIKEDK